jgi:hypothetical protein
MLATQEIVNFWVLKFLGKKSVQSESYNIYKNER